MGGTAFVPKDWCEHLGDSIITKSINLGCLYRVPKTCTELTERVMAQIPHMQYANNAWNFTVSDGENSADEADIARFYGGAVAADLQKRPGRSFDLNFNFIDARVIFDDEPSVMPGEGARMRIRFRRMLAGTGPVRLQLRWILPEGWSVEGCKKEVYVGHSRPSISPYRSDTAEISFTVRAGEVVDFQNRLILEAVCPGHPMPALIPITILG